MLDFDTPDHRMRIRSVHPGVTVDEVQAATGFELVVPDDVPTSRLPTPDELELIDTVIDPAGLRFTEVRAAEPDCRLAASKRGLRAITQGTGYRKDLRCASSASPSAS